MNEQPTREELLLACEALAKVVREEYGERYSLAEIAYTWGSADQPQRDAVASVEQYWDETTK